MLFVHDVDERGQDRVLVLPVGSIISYFTESDDKPGMVLHVEPGVCAFPSEFEAYQAAVRLAVLTEAGRRLLVPPDEVILQTLACLREVADPDVNRLSSFSRKRNKGRSGPFLL
jgi:hypothetical protein